MFLLLAPSLQKYNIAIFRAAEPMLQDMNTQAGLIQDTSVKGQYTNLINNQISFQTTQMDILSQLYQYAWVFILILSLLVLFLFSRSNVEAQTGRYA